MFAIYIINRAGGLIYQHDHNLPKVEIEKTFSYPLELTLKIYDEKVVVGFGQRDGIKGKLNLFCVRLYCYVLCSHMLVLYCAFRVTWL